MARKVAFRPGNAENPRAVTLQLYLLRQMMAALVVIAGGITFVVFPAVAVGAVHKLGGVNVGAMLGYLPLVGMGLVPYLVPMAFLLAVVSVFGRLAAQNEWTAIRMARVNPLKTLLPAILVALCLGGSTYYLLATVVPNYKYEQTVYRRSTVIEAFKNLSPGRTELTFEDFHLDAARRAGPNSFAEVLLYLPGPTPEEDQEFVAELATFKFTENELEISLTDARIVLDETAIEAGNIGLAVSLDQLFPPPSVSRTRGKYMTSKQMRDALDLSGPGEGIDAGKRVEYEYEVNRRRALSLSYLLFLFLGAPIGIALRKGTQLAAMTTGVGVAFIYYIASLRMGKQIIQMSDISPLVAVWSTNGIGAVIGLVLTWRIVRR